MRIFGAPSRIRTYDRLLKRQLLYQLSYERNFIKNIAYFKLQTGTL